MKPFGAAALFLVLFSPLPAQEPPAKPAPGKAERLLARAVHRIFGLEGYAFSGTVVFPGQEKAARAGKMAPFFFGALQPVGGDVKGRTWRNGLVSFTLDGTARGFMKGGFILYREGKNSWRLRFGTGEKGAPLWWIPDPNRLLEEILASRPKAKIVRNETLDQRPVRVLQVVLEKEAAQDLFLSRLLPDPSKAPFQQGGRRMVFILGPPMGPKVPRDLRYEILFWIEPGKAVLRRLRVKATASPKGFPGGRIRIQVQGGKPVPRTGKKKEISRVDLVIDFEEEEKVPAPDLPVSVARRLGLPFPPPGKEKGKKL